MNTCEFWGSINYEKYDEPPPIEEDEENGDLSYLYQTPPRQRWKFIRRFDRRSNPRWKSGRWKSKT